MACGCSRILPRVARSLVVARRLKLENLQTTRQANVVNGCQEALFSGCEGAVLEFGLDGRRRPPPTHVRRTLTVLAEPDRVRVLDGAAGFQREKDAERLDPAVET